MGAFVFLYKSKVSMMTESSFIQIQTRFEWNDVKSRIESLNPHKTHVMVFGRFQPPTRGHKKMLDVVRELRDMGFVHHSVFVSKTNDLTKPPASRKNPLTVEQKGSVMRKMFHDLNIIEASDVIPNPFEAAVAIANSELRPLNLIMVCGADRAESYARMLSRVPEYQQVVVVSAGKRISDSSTRGDADDDSHISGTMMRDLAKRGDFERFAHGTPELSISLKKELFNDVRVGLGLERITFGGSFSSRKKLVKNEAYWNRYYHVLIMP